MANVQADLKVLHQSIDKAEGDIDFLLTLEWPANVTALCAPGTLPEKEVAGTGTLAFLQHKLLMLSKYTGKHL